jgi:hypothetical protein
MSIFDFGFWIFDYEARQSMRNDLGHDLKRRNIKEGFLPSVEMTKPDSGDIA